MITNFFIVFLSYKFYSILILPILQNPLRDWESSTQQLCKDYNKSLNNFKIIKNPYIINFILASVILFNNIHRLSFQR